MLRGAKFGIESAWAEGCEDGFLLKVDSMQGKKNLLLISVC